ncbi:hypothetical protein MASR1M74_21740 [Lentimicrobium sp.]
MNKSILLLLFSIIFISISGVNAQVGIDTAADFTVKDLEGNLHHLYEYLDEDKLVVIDFFTTTCGPCQKYASEISASYEYFGCNAGNVIYLGINWGSDNEQVAVFDSLWGVHFPSISGQQGGGNSVVELYEVMSYPSVILIAPDRSILHPYIWPPQQDTINSLVYAAGGSPMPCTVNSTFVKYANDELVLAGRQADGIVFQVKQPENQCLRIFSADGRLVREMNIRKSLNYIRLETGLYIGVLSSVKGRQVLKFMVN